MTSKAAERVREALRELDGGTGRGIGKAEQILNDLIKELLQ